MTSASRSLRNTRAMYSLMWSMFLLLHQPLPILSKRMKKQTYKRQKEQGRVEDVMNGECPNAPQPSESPHDWKIPGTSLSRNSGRTDDFFDYFQCDVVFATTRPLHNESTWMLLRGAYQGVAGPMKSTIGRSVDSGIVSNSDNKNYRTSMSYESGFRIPYYTGQVPNGVGRGAFAALPIDKGTHIWTASTNSARFHSGQDFRQFLISIPTDLACDVLIWSYVQYVYDDSENEKLAIQCDLDDGSFVNTADIPEEANVGTASGHDEVNDGKMQAQNLFALRDIEAGEQLLVDYGEFAVPEGWEKFGLA